MKTKNITTYTENKLNTSKLRYIYYISTHFLRIKRVVKHLNLFTAHWIGVTLHRGCSSALPCFEPFSFYARSLLSLIRWTRLGWKMGGKAHKASSDLREEGRERDIRNILYTSQNVRWVVFHATSVWHIPTSYLVVCDLNMCYTAASFAPCTHTALLKMWQTETQLGHS